MIFVDLRKIPRPERSGYTAILLSYVLLCAAFEFGFTGEDMMLSLPSVSCMLFPFIPELCTTPPDEVAENEKPKQYRMTYVTFDSHSPIRNKKCTCHIDVEWFDGRPFQHLRMPTEPTCNSNLAEGWIEPLPPTTQFASTLTIMIEGQPKIEIHPGEGR